MSERPRIGVVGATGAVGSVTLAQPSTINVMVRGYASGSSSFELTGKKN